MEIEMRKLTAYIVSPIIAMTGKGFSRDHRINNTLVYKLVDTVAANAIALAINPMADRRA
jgi:hypothetical protein